jgi:hypothetical protein
MNISHAYHALFSLKCDQSMAYCVSGLLVVSTDNVVLGSQY